MPLPREDWDPNDIRRVRRSELPAFRPSRPVDPGRIERRMTELEQRIEDLAHRLSRFEEEDDDGD